jgi:hypothetical protein
VEALPGQQPQQVSIHGLRQNNHQRITTSVIKELFNSTGEQITIKPKLSSITIASTLVIGRHQTPQYIQIGEVLRSLGSYFIYKFIHFYVPLVEFRACLVQEFLSRNMWSLLHIVCFAHSKETAGTEFQRFWKC